MDVKNNFWTVQRILSTAGIVMLAFGVPFAFFWPDIFENILAKVRIFANFKNLDKKLSKRRIRESAKITEFHV